MHNKLTDNAGKDFAVIQCKLESLYISYSKFTDNAAKAFAAAALKHSNCKLELLDLKGEQYLTDAGKQSNCQVGC
mgnify:CR=1 FL=1